ncbi:MAG: DUF1844 domain-containing protein [Myxococcaceae bacterium]
MAERRGDGFVLGDADAPISFSTFVLGLASTALIHLGERPDPERNETGVDLVLAKQTLDLLELLQRKTRGNLDAEEDRLFQALLTDLRLKFLQKSKA